MYIYIYSDIDINIYIYIYMLHKTFCAKYLSDLFAVAHRNHGRHLTTGTHVMWCQSFRIAKILGVKDLIVISISKISNYYQLFGKSKNCKTSITVLFFRSNYWLLNRFGRQKPSPKKLRSWRARCTSCHRSAPAWWRPGRSSLGKPQPPRVPCQGAGRWGWAVPSGYVKIAMERSTIFHGKIHYFYGHVQ